MTDPARIEQFVLVGVDGSPESRTALRWAEYFARDLDCEIEAMLVWQAPMAFEFNMTTVIRDWDPQHECEKALTEIVDDVFGQQRPARLRLTVVGGYPARRLVERANAATMLVVGSRGHGAFASVALGSVSQRCVEYATCPVVVVKAANQPPAGAASGAVPGG
ncbi:MAG TPA: universal stress protein [Jatrophihabitans sp.]|jgi:nucleotide-binding universal stress UspA family protein